MKMGSPTLSFSINLDHVLYGEELVDIGSASIYVENGFIKEITPNKRGDALYSGGIALPLPVNAHVHLSDYRALDHYYGYSLENYVGRKGLKHALIQLYKEPVITDELLNALIQYPVIVDYQEKYEYCTIYSDLLSTYNVEYIGLSRPSMWEKEELDRSLMYCNGIGISNPTIVPPWIMHELAELSMKYLVSAHVSETKWMEYVGGLHYLLDHGVRLDHVVHGIYLKDWELKRLADEEIPLVITPRSNLWFTGKLPPIEKALNYGVTIALGSDNAGCFHPDIWFDLYVLLLYKRIDPLKLLEIALINGYKAIRKTPLVIEEGKPAYFMVVDLGLGNKRSGNIYLSIISRILWSSMRIIVKNTRVYVIQNKIK